MATQWKAVDNTASAPIWAPAQFKAKATRANANNLYAVANTTLIPGQMITLLAVSNDEDQTNPAVTHTGWVLKKEGTGGRVGRVTYETLVAGGITSENNTNKPFLNALHLWIANNPVSNSASLSNNGVAAFGVQGKASINGTALTYLWQYSTNGGSTWANASISGFSGYQTNSLSVNANTIANNTLLIVTVGATNALSVNSTTATFTRSP